jgi:dTDP-glucose 4,6-dehydratase
MEEKVILVTGGAGFIGSNFINYYINKYPNAKIINFDKLDYCSNENNIQNKTKNYVFINGNLTNKEFLLHILKQYNVNIVIHFAAQTHVDNSFGNSINFSIDNMIGTHTLLECCKEYGKIIRFLHQSTDEVYGEVDINHEGCTEKTLLNPTNPYAATKCGAEFIVRSYYHSFKIPIIIMRGNNVYGPYQYPEKLIPKFIQLLKNNKKCTIHGSGNSRRNFIHVDDVASSVDIILEKGEINNIYNIGTKNEYNVMEITTMLIKHIKPNDDVNDWIEYVDDRNFNDFRYAINNENLIKLGWIEKVEFNEGLKKVIDFYMNL